MLVKLEQIADFSGECAPRRESRILEIESLYPTNTEYARQRVKAVILAGRKSEI